MFFVQLKQAFSLKNYYIVSRVSVGDFVIFCMHNSITHRFQCAGFRVNHLHVNELSSLHKTNKTIKHEYTYKCVCVCVYYYAHAKAI